MAITRWRPLLDYHPAVRLMVRYMWRQEPPLLPSGFADQMGLPRQLVSRWLQIQAPETGADGTDIIAAAVPSLTPLLATRLARTMGVTPLEFFVAAGMCTYEEPLFTVEDAWEYVLARVTSTAAEDGGEDNEHAEDRMVSLDDMERVRHALQEAHTADLARAMHTISISPSVYDATPSETRTAGAENLESGG
jgi:hypothetical protein